MSSINKKSTIHLNIGQTILHFIFIIIALSYVVPFILIISVSLSSEASIAESGFSLLPKEFSIDAYRLALQNPQQLLQSYRITIIFTITATFLSVLTMGMLAYSLSRPQYKLKNALTFFVFFTMLFSGGLVPSYLLNARYLKLDNTIWIYILPSLASAWNVIIIRTNYKSLPDELIEAAKIDGANELYICFRIVMPLSVPVLATIAFLFFVGKWNDWYTAAIYVRDPKLYSLQYLLQRILREVEYMKQLAEEGQLIGEYEFPTESYRYAMALLAAGPVLIIFPFFQKYFARGLTIGAVKG